MLSPDRPCLRHKALTNSKIIEYCILPNFGHFLKFRLLFHPCKKFYELLSLTEISERYWTRDLNLKKDFLGLKFLFVTKYIMSVIQTGLLNFGHHMCFDI
jgi:hypothetical protein